MSLTVENQRQAFLESDVSQFTPLQRAVLPWVYVAWAEGSADPKALGQIAAQLAADSFEPAGLQAVHLLLDEILTPQEFNQLQRLIVQLARAQVDVEWVNLFRLRDFSQALAGTGLDEAGRQSLESLQQHLGLAGAAVPGELYPDPYKSTRRSNLPRRFNPRPLKKMLAGPRPELREKLFQALDHPRFRHEYGISTSTSRERVYSWCLEFSRQGLGKLPYPVEVGGGGDLLGFLAVTEALSHFDLSLVITFGAHFGLFCGSVFHLGTERHHQEILPPALQLELPGCFAMTETGHGSNVRFMETTATYDPELQEFILHTPNLAARKDYICNAAVHARLATVFAQLNIQGQTFGVHAFLVPIRDSRGEPMAGVHIEDCGEKIGLHGVDNGRLRFSHVHVPRLNLLDRFAQVAADGSYKSPITSPSRRFFTMISTLVLGRVTLAAAATSVAKNALTIALRYGEQRRQFGAEGAPEQSILDFQAQQRRLMPRLASTLALNFAFQDLSLRCVDSLDSDEGRRRVESLAAGLKAWGSRHAFDTVQICRECCGGQGCLAANRLGAMRNDLDVCLTFEGDNTVLMQLVAKSLLTEYRHQFSETGLGGLLQYLSRRATEAASAWNPLVTRSTDAAHLRDFDFHEGAFKARENHLLSRLAGRLQGLIQAGSEPFSAFNQCQDHLVTLAKASLERELLECFQAAVQRCADAPTQAVLSQFCCLFALSRLEEDRAWFLENGYFEGAKSKAIRDQVLKLCHQTRLIAWDVIAAFGIPDKLLAAPIALGDYPAPAVGRLPA